MTAAHLPQALLDAVGELQALGTSQSLAFRLLAAHVHRTVARNRNGTFAGDQAYFAALGQSIVHLARAHGISLGRMEALVYDIPDPGPP